MFPPPNESSRFLCDRGESSVDQQRASGHLLTEDAKRLTRTVDQMTKEASFLSWSVDMMTGHDDELKETVRLLVGNVDILRDGLNSLATRICRFGTQEDLSLPSADTSTSLSSPQMSPPPFKRSRLHSDSETSADQEQQSQFLLLPPEVVRRLLLFVATGDGGLKSTLCLRGTCTVTKSWVDTHAEETFARSHVEVDLKGNGGSGLAGEERRKISRVPGTSAMRPELRRQRQIIFTSNRRVHANVDLRSSQDGHSPHQTLERFLQTPPPPLVTSLRLLGVNKLTEKTFSQNEELLWTRFVAFWTPKLENLEVDFVDNLLNPVDSRVNQLLCSPSLRHLDCRTLEHLDSSRFPVELPKSLFYLEQISIGNLNLDSFRTFQFFSSLSRNEELRSLEIEVTGHDVLTEVTKFIDLTRLNSHLEMRLKMRHLSISHLDYPKLLQNFVCSVAASTSSIRILNLDEVQLDVNVDSEVPDEVLSKFCECVEWLTRTSSLKPDGLLKFPNLRRLDLLLNSSADLDMRFPEELLRLGVLVGIPRHLPRSLTHLNVTLCRCSLSELKTSLTLLAACCPSLHTLHVAWKCCGYVETSAISTATKTTEIPFRNLRSLTLVLGIEVSMSSKTITGAREILLNTLQLPRLHLLHFKLQSDSNYPAVFGCRSFRRLIAGNVARSLVTLDVGKFSVKKKALPLLEKLRSMVAANEKKRREVFGSKWNKFMSE